jgi:hypothetical protein
MSRPLIKYAYHLSPALLIWAGVRLKEGLFKRQLTAMSSHWKATVLYLRQRELLNGRLNLIEVGLSSLEVARKCHITLAAHLLHLEKKIAPFAMLGKLKFCLLNPALVITEHKNADRNLWCESRHCHLG